MADLLIEEADKQQEARGDGDPKDAAENEVLRPSEDDISIVDSSADAGERVMAVEQEIVLVRRKIGRANAEEDKTEKRAGQREGVGEGVRLPIHDEQPDEEKSEDGQRDGVDGCGGEDIGGDARLEQRKGSARGEGEPEGEGELNCGITPGDALLTVAATGSEEDPAEQWNVVVPGDGVRAVCAVRARLTQAAVIRQARDTNVEEASEEQSQKKGGQFEDEWSGELESSV